jgi:hypothetical protein
MTMLDTITRRPPGERRNNAVRDALTGRVYAEFAEMRCMRLTPAQARRLFDLRADVAERILSALVRQGSLTWDGERYRFNDLSSLPQIPPSQALVRRRAS